MKNSFKLLDCTIRDGGYYNDWNFSDELVLEYLDLMQKSPIEIVEIGFRSASTDKILGAYAYSEPSYVEQIVKKSNFKKSIAVMINATDIKKLGNQNIINLLKERPDCFKMVRFATDPEDVERVINISDKIKSFGYTVGINIMKISSLDLDELEKLVKKIHKSNIDIIYIADSYGSLNISKVKDVFKVISQNTSKPMGMHAHNNLNLALENTLTAIDEGCEYIDSTVLGMGRGAGNCRTEELIEILSHKKFIKTSMKSSDLIGSYLPKLKDEYRWGPNHFYFLAGLHEIHPTYIQTMEQDHRYTEDRKYSIIENLKGDIGKRFNRKNLSSNEESSDVFIRKFKNTLDLSKFKNKKILLLGAGPSLSFSKEQINFFISSVKPTVISINKNRVINQDLVDIETYYHLERFFSDQEDIDSKNNIITSTQIHNELGDRKNTFSFNVKRSEKDIEIDDKSISIFDNITAQMALMACLKLDCEEIYLIGFDGSSNFEDLDGMNFFLKTFQKKYSKEIFSLSKTKLNIKMKSPVVL